MCWHKLYIFTTCGHSTYSSQPLIICRDASIGPSSTYSESCNLRAHPFHTIKIEQNCFACRKQRDRLMERLDNAQVVRFDECRWKVSYDTPSPALLLSPKTVSEPMKSPAEIKLPDAKGGKKGKRWSFGRSIVRSSLRTTRK